MTSPLILPFDQRSVMAPNGKAIFGQISPEVAEQIGVEPGDIRLLNGFQTGHSGFGLCHLQSKADRVLQMKGLGFRNPEAFVWNICQNFQTIHQGGERFGLCYDHKHHSLLAYIDWRADRGFWSIVTAIPMRKCREPLLLDLRTGDRSEPDQTSP